MTKAKDIADIGSIKDLQVDQYEWGKLQLPFAQSDVEWRIQMSGFKGGKPWARVLCYITNRAVLQRMDDVFGPGNWQNDFKEGPGGGVICGLSVRLRGLSYSDWVTKWDGAANTSFEAIKGGLSGAMKRAAVQWGIGRYLYNLKEGWADFNENGRYKAKFENKDGSFGYWAWDPPELPEWALPAGETQDVSQYAAQMSPDELRGDAPKRAVEDKPPPPRPAGGAPPPGKGSDSYSGQPLRDPDSPRTDGQKKMLWVMLKKAKDRMAKATWDHLTDANEGGKLTKQQASDTIQEIKNTYGV